MRRLRARLDKASMGLTHVTVHVRSITGEGTPFSADFLVDTGATDSMAPGNKLKTAGVKPEGKKVYELATGETVEFEFGYARIDLLGDETIVRISFGPDDAEPILGVLALESLGIVVDPKSERLMRLPVLPLK